MKITAEQLWAAVKRGESDAVIGSKLGRSERSIQYLRKVHGVPSATQLGTIIADRPHRETAVMPLPPDEPGMAGQKAIQLPDPNEEERWNQRLRKAGRFEDARVARAPRLRVRAAMPLLNKSIMA